MSYHFCCFRTLSQDPCPIDFFQLGQEVLSVVWKMCNTASIAVRSSKLSPVCFNCSRQDILWWCLKETSLLRECWRFVLPFISLFIPVLTAVVVLQRVYISQMMIIPELLRSGLFLMHSFTLTSLSNYTPEFQNTYLFASYFGPCKYKPFLQI